MIEPSRPWPLPPPRNHMHFHPEGMLGAYTPDRGGADLFFCHGLSPKSPQARMMEAVARFDTAQLAALVAAHPAVPPDFQNGNGVTLLMVAAARGNTDALHALANHPLVDLSQKSRDGWTALHYAAWFGKVDCVTALLKRAADFKAVNTAGETPFALAANTQTQEAFRAHKPFLAHMKRSNTGQTRRAPAAAVPPQDAGLSLTTLFLQAMLDIPAIARGLHGRLKAEIAAGGAESLPAAYAYIEEATIKAQARGRRVDFDWDGLLATAAAAGNIPALAFIAAQRDYMDSAPLTKALAALIAEGEDSPQTAEAAQWLLRWGADANASGKAIRGVGSKAGTLAYQAFARSKPLVFESFCLHPGDLKTWHVSQQQLAWEQAIDRCRTGDTIPDPRTDALAILKRRRQMRLMGEDMLRAALNAALAASHLPAVKAAYAETRSKRLFHDAFALSPEKGAAAMLLALQHGETCFAKRLAADGYRIGKLDPSGAAALHRLETKGDAAQKHLIHALKAGTAEDAALLPVAEKYRRLRAQVLPLSGRFGF
jgi:hypothetical protein